MSVGVNDLLRLTQLFKIQITHADALIKTGFYGGASIHKILKILVVTIK